MPNVDPEVRFNFSLAYDVYRYAKIAWPNLSDKAKKRARRQVESVMREAGFNGKPTGLISEAAFETVINQKKGIKPTIASRTATEHPITYTNIALYCLEQDQLLSYAEYLDIWFDNLITTITTNEENQRLKKYQAEFKFGVDDWKQMYDNAGIKLMERPMLRSHADKKKWGLM